MTSPESRASADDPFPRRRTWGGDGGDDKDEARRSTTAGIVGADTETRHGGGRRQRHREGRRRRGAGRRRRREGRRRSRVGRQREGQRDGERRAAGGRNDARDDARDGAERADARDARDARDVAEGDDARRASEAAETPCSLSRQPQPRQPQPRQPQPRQPQPQQPPPPRASTEPRRSLSYSLRPSASAYYDSRAATRTEWKRRAKTLAEYYDDNPHLLPQLPFTWHHGQRRWRLFLFAVFVFVDASLVPIALYYGLAYGGDVQGWIIFAVVTTIWGGPTYLEFAVRTLRLVKRERFYRPLGTDSRWCFDLVTWASVLTITAVTALFIVGSAPHIVWLRVLCMPAPAILYCLGGVLAAVTLFHRLGWRAPFRISSTARGCKVLPGAYYFIEDVAAVNAGAGQAFREALAARYKASRRFRRMLYAQSLFWSLPALLLAAVLTVVAVIPPVPAPVAYGICWAVPFLWSAVWGGLTVVWCKREMARERLEWEASCGRGPGEAPSEAASAS